MISIVSIGVIVVVVVLCMAWIRRGRTRRAEPGPMVADLGTAEDIVHLDELRAQGKLTDAEYHEAKGKLLS